MAKALKFLHHLDEQATAAYRASRGLDDTNPLGLVPGPDGAGDDDKENTR